MTTLTHLDLSGTGWKADSSINNLTNLVQLKLDENAGGTLDISNLSKLETLSVRNSGLSSITVGNLSALKELDKKDSHQQ